jgi:rhodanese-related sulfurtransferase
MFGSLTNQAYQNLNAQEFSKLLADNPNAVLIDVRSPGELDDGIIEGAINFNVMEPNFEDKVEKLDKEKSYFLYCRSGNRSGMACSRMASMGFKNLYNLAGGVMAWSIEMPLV